LCWWVGCSLFDSASACLSSTCDLPPARSRRCKLISRQHCLDRCTQNLRYVHAFNFSWVDGFRGRLCSALAWPCPPSLLSASVAAFASTLELNLHCRPRRANYSYPRSTHASTTKREPCNPSKSIHSRQLPWSRGWGSSWSRTHPSTCSTQGWVELVRPFAKCRLLQLLRYREQADYGDRSDQTPCTGRHAYWHRYAPVSTGLLTADGGIGLPFIGKTLGELVAPAGEKWECVAKLHAPAWVTERPCSTVLLVRYRNYAQFVRLFNDPAYQAVLFHRTAALSDSRLFMNVEAPDPSALA
jgi:hypothetical protein